MTIDMGPIFDAAYRYNPALMTRDFSPIRQWIACGCDVDKDILPTMNHMMFRNREIKGFGYFTAAIYEARDKRLAAERMKEIDAMPAKSGDIHLKAKMAARTVRVFGIKDAMALNYLEAYEAKHGKVAV